MHNLQYRLKRPTGGGRGAPVQYRNSPRNGGGRNSEHGVQQGSMVGMKLATQARFFGPRNGLGRLTRASARAKIRGKVNRDNSGQLVIPDTWNLFANNFLTLLLYATKFTVHKLENILKLCAKIYLSFMRLTIDYLTCTTPNRISKNFTQARFALVSLLNLLNFHQTNLKPCPNYVLESALTILPIVLLP